MRRSGIAGAGLISKNLTTTWLYARTANWKAATQQKIFSQMLPTVLLWVLFNLS